MMDDTLMSFPPDRLPCIRSLLIHTIRHSAAPFGIQIAMNQFATQLNVRYSVAPFAIPYALVPVFIYAMLT